MHSGTIYLTSDVMGGILPGALASLVIAFPLVFYFKDRQRFKKVVPPAVVILALWCLLFPASAMCPPYHNYVTAFFGGSLALLLVHLYRKVPSEGRDYTAVLLLSSLFVFLSGLKFPFDLYSIASGEMGELERRLEEMNSENAAELREKDNLTLEYHGEPVSEVH